MLRLFIDQNFHAGILRGLRRRISSLDAVTAREVGLDSASDSALLEWAARNGRMLVTHDRRTMPLYAGELLAAGRNIAGVCIASRELPMLAVIDDLEIMVRCSEASEWENRIIYLPL